MKRRATAPLAAAAGLVASAAFAHGDVDVRIQEVTQQIQLHDDQPDLFIRRGRLSLDAGHEQEAKGDLVRALRLDPSRYEARFYLGQAQLRMGQYDAALRSVEGFLTAADSEAARSRGLNLKGDVLFAAHQPLGAAEAYLAGLDLEREPNPDHVVETADAFHAAGHGDRAIAVLDEAVERLGPLTVLEERAIAIDLELRRHDDALERVDRLIAGGQRLPYLLHRKAQVLAAMQRPDDARAADHAALDALDRLPGARQASGALQALRASIEQALGAADPRDATPLVSEGLARR